MFNFSTTYYVLTRFLTIGFLTSLWKLEQVFNLTFGVGDFGDILFID